MPTFAALRVSSAAEKEKDEGECDNGLDEGSVHRDGEVGSPRQSASQNPSVKKQRTMQEHFTAVMSAADKRMAQKRLTFAAVMNGWSYNSLGSTSFSHFLSAVKPGTDILLRKRANSFMKSLPVCGQIFLPPPRLSLAPCGRSCILN